jgi:HAD superfamily hydrolase (TIGR01459 family)
MQALPRLLHDGLAEVAGAYDGFILDLWGVVHDGTKVFPDTVSTLREMKRAKRKVWLLSNAPRRAFIVREQLERMGVTPDLYTGVMTSGEASWQALQNRYLKEWGRKCYHLGPGRDESLYQDLDMELVIAPESADFILNTGVLDFSHDPNVYAPVLEAAAARNLPMLCANPDRIVHVGDKLVYCAGAIADVYSGMDGAVAFIGKPHKEVYRLCFDGLGTRKVLAVGDAMPTDVAGAVGAGIDSVLVQGGIHRDDLPRIAEMTAEKGRPEKFFSGYLYRPNFVIDRLHWSK